MVPDYYARLEVEPGADAAEVEAALRRKQPAWSMGTRNPKSRHTNQLYLDEIPDLRRALLGGPAARAAYDAELAAAKAEERQRKLDEVQRLIRLRAAKGGLSGRDRALLRDEVARRGLEADVLDRLTRPIPSLDEARPAEGADLAEEDDAPVDVLDPSTRGQIRLALQHLGRRDLYDALGLFRDASASVIAARADEERRRWMRKAQVTAEKTAWLEVISHAQTHLGTPKARVRYDRTLTLEAEEAFDAVTSFALAGLARLDPGTRAALFDEAHALGIGSARAALLVARACRRLGVVPDPGPAAAPAAPTPDAAKGAAAPGPAPGANGYGSYKLLRCRGCAGVTELSPVGRKASAARCGHCGDSLKWECPVCRRGHWVDEPKCACGFKLAALELVVRHFAAAQQAFRGRDLEGAREHLERVRRHAPNHVGARNGLEKVRQKEREIEHARLAFELAFEGRRMVAARKAVDDWGGLAEDGSADWRLARDEVNRALKEAEALAAQARRLEQADPAAARARYRRSLEVAADLPAALAGLERCPPDSPTDLTARVRGDRIELNWTAPPPDGLGPVTYVVLRKRGGLPGHPGDGTPIAEVSPCEFADRKAPPGEPVSYAVRSRRNGVESTSAVAVGPRIFLADVEEVRVEAGGREVELTWVPPRGAAEVRVVRKEGSPPEGPRDGLPIAAGLDYAVDGHRPPDRPCFYGIYAIYRSEGRKYPSPGVVVSARAREPAPPPGAPRLLPAPGGGVRLEWAEPPLGSVRILRTARPVPHPPGARLAPAEAERLEGRWVEPTGPGRAEDFDPPPAGPCHYTPVLFSVDAATIGHGVPLGRVADPADLRAARVGGPAGDGAGAPALRVQLRWAWPEGVEAARVVARRGLPPDGPWDPAAAGVAVSRREYDRAGSWTIDLAALGAADAAHEPSDFAPEPARPPGAEPWHLRVFGLAEAEGAVVASPGLEPTAATSVAGPHPEVVLGYRLRRPWLGRRAWSVVLETEPHGSPTPPLVVVANPRAIPLSPDDGEVLDRLPPARDGSSFPIRTRLDLRRCGVRLFPDPTADPEAISPVRLRHPEAGPTRA